MSQTTSLDVKPLSRVETNVYLSIVAGEDVTIKGSKGKMTVWQIQGGKKYEVYSPVSEKVVRSFTYPIDAMSLAVKMAGGLESWTM